MIRLPTALAALVLGALVLAALPPAFLPAYAQTSGNPTTPPTAAPRTDAPDAGDRGTSGIPRGGVITPPPTRAMPQADVPAERPNSMPVIPPPGTPGGNPNVQPR